MYKLFIVLLLVPMFLMAQDSQLGQMHPQTGKYSPINENNWARESFSLGAHLVNSDATFALFAKNAHKVLLEIYTKSCGEHAKYDYWMQKGDDDVWRAKIAQVDSIVFYGFRLWGPNWNYDLAWKRGNSSAGYKSDFDAEANRYNPNKVVFDPYAREMSHDKSNPAVLGNHNGGMFGTGDGDYKGVVRRNFDTGKWAPKAILFKDDTSTGNKPNLPAKDAIICEAHVRGLCQHPSVVNLRQIVAGIPGMENVVSVPDKYRGTYKGVAYMAKYLKALGYTTVELLPVHETDNDNNPSDNPGGNYWGYMTYSYFAPDRRYAYDKSPGGPTREFKSMVKAFHDAGLEVYLDVVYNHTGEGGTWDPTGETAEITCYRGIDNSQYYAIPKGAPQAYWETTGCGNNFDASRWRVCELIKDSLRYWINEMGVDGFRFDLATVLGRDSYPNYYFNSNAKLLTEIADIARNTNSEMIAEAWDISTYQVGNFPYGWGEWNGKYRDAVRRFIKGGGTATGFTDYFNGSYHLFNDQGGPQQSVNFITAHDGFTLMDLVSYNNKNNKVSWPFGPSDGGNDNNDSWDHGGDQALRRKQLRNLWVIQTFARGVPMGVWGDEFGRTQNGNNNPYNIDSVATWSNYKMIASDSPNNVATGAGGCYHNNFGTDGNPDGKNALFIFVKNVLHVRKAHLALRQNSFRVPYHFAKADGGTLGGNDRVIRVHIDGSVVGDSDFLLLINTWTEAINFKLFQADSGKRWTRLIDTANWAETSNNFWANDPATISDNYKVNPWAIVVLQSK